MKILLFLNFLFRWSTFLTEPGWSFLFILMRQTEIRLLSSMISDQVVKPTMTISRPCGYLFPKSHQDLIDWAFRHGLKVKPLKKDKNIMFEQLIINKIGSIDFERDTIAIRRLVCRR